VGAHYRVPTVSFRHGAAKPRVPSRAKTNVGKACLDSSAWLWVPFSVWRASVRVFTEQWLTFSFVAFLSVAGLVRNHSQWLSCSQIPHIRLLVFTIIANVFGFRTTAVFSLEQGKFGNPKEVAQALPRRPLWGVMMVNSKLLQAGVCVGRGAVLGTLPHWLAGAHDRLWRCCW
jgi:hypothetical protein